MNTVLNETLNSTVSADVVSPQTGPMDAEAFFKAAKDKLGLLNKAEARSRKALAEMVAVLVEMGYAYVGDQTVTNAIDAECKKHGIDPVKLNDPDSTRKTAPNIFLPMISIVDGKWEPVFNSKTGKPVMEKGTDKQQTKWARNRSLEKFASVVRFFIHNDISHLEVIDILMGDKPIAVEGFDDGVHPRIADIVKADAEQQNGKKRTPGVWDSTKAAVKVLKPVAVIPLTPALRKALSFSDGYSAPVVHVNGDNLEILFDSGLKEEALYKVIKRGAAVATEILKDQVKTSKAAA